MNAAIAQITSSDLLCGESLAYEGLLPRLGPLSTSLTIPRDHLVANQI